jgi:hypothetical protein
MSTLVCLWWKNNQLSIMNIMFPRFLYVVKFVTDSLHNPCYTDQFPQCYLKNFRKWCSVYHSISYIGTKCIWVLINIFNCYCNNRVSKVAILKTFIKHRHNLQLNLCSSVSVLLERSCPLAGIVFQELTVTRPQMMKWTSLYSHNFLNKKFYISRELIHLQEFQKEEQVQIVKHVIHEYDIK